MECGGTGHRTPKKKGSPLGEPSLGQDFLLTAGGGALGINRCGAIEIEELIAKGRVVLVASATFRIDRVIQTATRN